MSRYEDKTLVECDECHWRGTIADCIHTYRNYIDESEPVDLCPKCGSDQLLDIDEDTANLILCPA